MKSLDGVFSNPALASAFTAWIVAQTIKMILTVVITKKVDWTRFFGAGGMPSSHSSSTIALATSVGMIEGFDSVPFAITFVLALIVMYDAAGVRRAAGKQAKVLNEVIELLWEHKAVPEAKLKELLGHTPFEVTAGAILGIILGVLVTVALT